MPAAFMRSCAVAATMAGAAATEGMPSCAHIGTGFDDPKRDSLPNGGRPVNALACMALCQTTAFCERFTFYTDSNGCWLQGNNYTTIENEFAVSGPARCDEVLNDAISGEDSESGKALVGAGGSGAGGIPWWGIAAGGLGAAVVGAGAFAVLAPGDKRKKVSKRGIRFDNEDGPKTAAELYAQMAGLEAPVPAPGPKTAAELYAQMAGVQMPASAPALAPAAQIQFSQMAPMPQMAPYAYAPQASYVQVPTEPVQYLQLQP